MFIKRLLDLKEILNKKSFFLFGPRSTGKSTLIKQQLADSPFVIDLLDSRLFLRLSGAPHEIEEIINAGGSNLVVIDEIQRIPELLNEVHRLIENRKIRFLLTGSSARKLRRGNANLLAGRVWEARLFPLTWRELPDFKLERYLRYGGLPQVYLSEYPDEELDAYVNIYLKEEIMAEGLIRNLPPFARFLKSISLSNGEVVNFTKLGNDCQISASTVREYISLLEDTLVGFLIPAWTESKKRKAIKSGKFYFFDTGVTHTLSGTQSLDRNSDLYGKSFEQFICMELRAYLSYKRNKSPLSYWRSTHGNEVDFLIGEDVAIEVKSSQRITPSDYKGLKALNEEGIFKDLYLTSQDPVASKNENINSLHWKDFLEKLWQGKII
ncbi:MAG: ATP-binding protein [Desulfatiglans sp.]|jgi:predicted AAA+ superfamily ATPase|nr:ATP-binding protein [Desulfatiglans sp.]